MIGTYTFAVGVLTLGGGEGRGEAVAIQAQAYHRSPFDPAPAERRLTDQGSPGFVLEADPRLGRRR